MATIEIDDENGFRSCVLDAQETIIGRHPACPLRIRQRNISRQHARIILEDGEYFVEDCGSLNGTFLNGARIEDRERISDGDIIHVYKVKMIFHAGDPPSRALQAKEGSPLATPLGQPAEAGSGLPQPPADAGHGPCGSSIVHRTSADPDAIFHVEPQRKLEALFTATRLMAEASDLEQVLPKFLDALFEIFPQTGRGHIVFSTGPRDQGILFADRVRKDEPQQETTLGPVRNSIADEVFSSRQAYVGLDRIKGSDSDSIFDLTPRSAMYAPLQNNKQVLGVVYLDTYETLNHFDEKDLGVLITTAAAAGGLMHHYSQLRSYAEIDKNVKKQL